MLVGVVLAAAMATSEQRIDVWAYGCDFSTAKTAVIYAQNRHLFGGAGKEIKVPAAVDAGGKRVRFSFTLPADAFYISYGVVGQECHSMGQGLAILPGHDRHILVSMQPGVWFSDWHARRFFAGLIPEPRVGVSVVISNDTTCPLDKDVPEYPATIDAGAYYVSYVSRGHAFLKLRSAGRDVVFIALPDEPQPQIADQYVVRDITFDDLQHLATHKDPNRQECVQTPSGTSKRFDM